jgi:trehalose 6-phosphate synthase
MAGHLKLIETIRLLIGERQLVVVSNREPYVHMREHGEVAVSRTAGGLVAALDPVMQAVSGTWVAWGSGEADFDVTDAQGRVRVPPEGAQYTLKRVPLSHEEIDDYYYGYANQALWPLFHFIPHRARFRRRYWQSYRWVNRRFAEAVLDEADRDAVVWIHDYHLMLAPRTVRDVRPGLFLMYFWHIPWPNYEVWRMCPQRGELLDGLLASDLIGFQRPRHVQAFLECVRQELPAEIDPEQGTVTYDGRVTHVRAFPISVDCVALDRAAKSAAALRWMARFRRRYNLLEQIVALGVDRLDYTKGIPHRLQALGALYGRIPGFRERITFIQKSVPSRTRIAAYRSLAQEVERMIAELNTTYRTTRWQPVVHLTQPLSFEALAALYRLADICVVSSLQDGMNLVAKEFVACQVDESGVLILSELAGAQRELTGAITINPNDLDGFVAALQQAIEMPPEERRSRMTQMRAYLADHDIYHWLEHQFRAAAGLLAERGRVPSLFDHLDDAHACVRGRNRLAVLLDFDGTLAPISEDPATVILPAEVESTLRRLVNVPGVMVAILSGRALTDLQQRVGIDGVVYVGNHGLEMAGAGWSWTHDEAARIAPVIAQIAARLHRRLRRVPGVLIEEKGLTASVHYRRVPPAHHEGVRLAVNAEVESTGDPRLRVTAGKRVVEVRPNVVWDKGAAARSLLERTYGSGWPDLSCVFYAGDDSTDEDAFRALGDAAITVKVGTPMPPTAARFLVHSSADVGALLTRLVEWRSA